MADKKLTLGDVANSIVALGTRLKTQWTNNGWQPNQNAHSLNWVAPSITMNDVIKELEFAAGRVKALEDIGLLE